MPTDYGGSIGTANNESVHKWRQEPNRLPDDALNMFIVMLDDTGFSQAEEFGGEITTPKLSRRAQKGIVYTAFHATVMGATDTRLRVDRQDPLLSGRGSDREIRR